MCDITCHQISTCKKAAALRTKNVKRIIVLCTKKGDQIRNLLKAHITARYPLQTNLVTMSDKNPKKLSWYFATSHDLIYRQFVRTPSLVLRFSFSHLVPSRNHFYRFCFELPNTHFLYISASNKFVWDILTDKDRLRNNGKLPLQTC